MLRKFRCERKVQRYMSCWETVISYVTKSKRELSLITKSYRDCGSEVSTASSTFSNLPPYSSYSFTTPRSPHLTFDILILIILVSSLGEFPARLRLNTKYIIVFYKKLVGLQVSQIQIPSFFL